MKDPPETHCGGREQGKLMWIQMKFILNDEEIGQAADFSDSFGKFQQHPHLRRSGLHWAGSEDHASIGLEKRAGKF